MPNHIVAVLVDQTGAESTLKAAYEASLAIEDSRVVAFHVTVDPESTILPTEEMMTDPRRRELETAEKETVLRLRGIYTGIAEQLEPDKFEWQQVFGREKDEIARLTTATRLIVMHLPGARASGYVREAFQTALYETQRPLLIVPSSYQRRPVERVVIGWNDDGSCLKSVEAAAPWLRRAQMVSVIHIGATPRSEHFDKVKDLLASLGVQSSFRMLEPNGMGEGERILAAAVDADWLVMGGYHHKQLLEWIGGGISRTVFHEAKLPVFTMH